jgi:hypothetical protein
MVVVGVVASGGESLFGMFGRFYGSGFLNATFVVVRRALA